MESGNLFGFDARNRLRNPPGGRGDLWAVTRRFSGKPHRVNDGVIKEWRYCMREEFPGRARRACAVAGMLRVRLITVCSGVWTFTATTTTTKRFFLSFLPLRAALKRRVL